MHDLPDGKRPLLHGDGQEMCVPRRITSSAASALCVLTCATATAAEMPPMCEQVDMKMSLPMEPFPPKCFPGNFKMKGVIRAEITEKGRVGTLLITDIEGLPQRSVKCATEHFKAEYRRARYSAKELPCLLVAPFNAEAS
jgi:hypothetical protein